MPLSKDALSAAWSRHWSLPFKPLKVERACCGDQYFLKFQIIGLANGYRSETLGDLCLHFLALQPFVLLTLWSIGPIQLFYFLLSLS
jgi:hypothetical protein